jgi:hypothetical protein
MWHFPCACVSKLLIFIRIFWFRAHFNYFTFTWSFAKSLFTNKVTSTGTYGLALQHLWGEGHLIHIHEQLSSVMGRQ